LLTYHPVLFSPIPLQIIAEGSARHCEIKEDKPQNQDAAAREPSTATAPASKASVASGKPKDKPAKAAQAL
jgi:3-oxoacyl-ACP reductase-like protein